MHAIFIIAVDFPFIDVQSLNIFDNSLRLFNNYCKVVKKTNRTIVYCRNYKAGDFQ